MNRRGFFKGFALLFSGFIGKAESNDRVNHDFKIPKQFNAFPDCSFYIGKPNSDPSIFSNQIPVYIRDNNGSTVEVSQPILIGLDGLPEYKNKKHNFFSMQDFSMIIYDSEMNEKFYCDKFSEESSDFITKQISSPYGASLIGLKQGGTVQNEIDNLLRGGAIRISSFLSNGISDAEVIEKAIKFSLDEKGYITKPIWNDTDRPIEITSRIIFQSHENVSVNAKSYTGNRCGVFGEFKFKNGGGFDFKNTYDAIIDIIVLDGGGNSINETNEEDSSFAVKFTGGNNIGCTIKISGYSYAGWLVGSTDIKEYNIQCMKDSSINAYSCGGPLFFTHETGVGSFINIWQELCLFGPRIDNVNDLTIHNYENYQSISHSGGDFEIKSCLSCHITNFLSGNGGNPQLKIYDSWVDIKTLLVIPGPYKKNEATSEYYAVEVSASKLQISNMSGSSVGSIMKVGNDSYVYIYSFTGSDINQFIRVTNETGYDGRVKEKCATINVNNIYINNGNNDFCYSPKSCIDIDDDMKVDLTVLSARVWWSNSRGKDKEYRYFINSGASTEGQFFLDNLILKGKYQDGFCCKFSNVSCISRLRTFGRECLVGSHSTMSNGTILPIGNLIGNNEKVISSNVRYRFFFHLTLREGGEFYIFKNGREIIRYSNFIGVITIPSIDVNPNESIYYHGVGDYQIDGGYGEFLFY